ncbi:hypothetical protein [Burkholderia multivorans]|uniref:hypothetical protein n=1 Tax=Burkholderia multivorans TaxID=87883 RepID=UPI0021BF417E|nr:hypothetical protein [Burkholderia multivorans]
MKIKYLPTIIAALCAASALYGCDSGSSKSESEAAASSAVEASAASDTSSPQSATVKLAQTPEEKRFLEDAGCLDENECFTAEKFDRFIVKKYPDIAKIRFRVSSDLEGDKEAIATARMDFRRGLYFAKQIRLADGRSLFDLLSTCSHSFNPNNVAQFAYDPATSKPYIFMQYFPVFMQKGTGKNFELNLLWDRVGDELRARSPFFSTNVLVDKDYLDMHGVACRSKNSPDDADE